MDKTADYITEEKRQALEAELADLKGPKRKEILDALEYAKSLGDPFRECRVPPGPRGSGQARRAHRQSRGDPALVASRFRIRRRHRADRLQSHRYQRRRFRRKIYQIVGAEEADMAAGKILEQVSVRLGALRQEEGRRRLFQLLPAAQSIIKS